MLKQKNLRNRLGALYAIWKNLGHDDSPSLRNKFFKKGILDDIREIWDIAPNFRFVIIKVLIALMKGDIPSIRDQIDCQFTQVLKEEINDEETMIVCSAIFLLANLVKVEGEGRKNWSQKDILDLIDKILEIEEDNRESRESLLAVKYSVFNQLLSHINKQSWKNYTYAWIAFTSRILSIGLIREKKNEEFENWLINQKKILLNFLKDSEKLEELKNLCKLQGVCFFILFVYQNLKKELMDSGFRKIFQKELQELPFTAM